MKQLLSKVSKEDRNKVIKLLRKLGYNFREIANFKVNLTRQGVQEAISPKKK